MKERVKGSEYSSLVHRIKTVEYDEGFGGEEEDKTGPRRHKVGATAESVW